MFSRIANLCKGFLSLFVSGVERRNPEALLEVEKESLRTQIGRYNDGLSSHAGLCERLMSQVKKLEADEQDLKSRTTAHLRAGNRDVAAQYALRLQTVTRELDENRKQMQQAEETYKTMLKSRDVAIVAAKTKIESLKQNIDDLKVKKAMAELTEMASGTISRIGGSGDTLDRLNTMVEEERNKAAGRARVARDTLKTSDIEIKDAEQRALADQALADFAAQQGLTVESLPNNLAAPATPISKTLGPGGEITQ